MNDERIFWDWFTAHKGELEQFESLATDSAETLLEEILTALQAVSDGLYFELSVRERPCELIISAGGDTALFPVVRRLVDAAPEIPGWLIIAFKQSQPDLRNCDWEGVSIDIATLRFQPLISRNDSERIGLRFLVSSEAAEARKETLAALHVMVDTLLGEEIAALTIAHIEVAGRASDPENFAPIAALPAFVHGFR